jgi:hypothetical protein
VQPVKLAVFIIKTISRQRDYLEEAFIRPNVATLGGIVRSKASPN